MVSIPNTNSGDRKLKLSKALHTSGICWAHTVAHCFSQVLSPLLQDSDKGIFLDPSRQTRRDTWLQFLRRSFLHTPPGGSRTCYNTARFNRSTAKQSIQTRTNSMGPVSEILFWDENFRINTMFVHHRSRVA